MWVLQNLERPINVNMTRANMLVCMQICSTYIVTSLSLYKITQNLNRTSNVFEVPPKLQLLIVHLLQLV